MTRFIDFLYRHLFLTLLTVGVIFSSVLRGGVERYWEGIGTGMASAMATFVCLLCLFAYYLVCKRVHEREGHMENEVHNPDNLYYMGFLFTLCSLIYSLITLFLFGEVGVGIENQVYNLIGSFGIALISTAFGILFRILVLQTRQVPSEATRRMAERQLAEASLRLREELGHTVSEMTAFRRAILQASEGAVRDMEQSRRETLRQFGTAAQDLVATARNTEKSLDEALSASSDRIARGAASIETGLGSVREPLNEIVLNLQAAGKNAQGLASDMEKSVAAFTETEDKLESAMKNLTEAMETFSGFLAQAAEITPQYTRQFEESVKTLREEAEKWETMTGEVRSALAQAMKDLIKTVRRAA